MSKVWQKGQSDKLDPYIESYEIGSDYIYDGKLFRYELCATAAHSIMLKSINILNDKELMDIKREIKRLANSNGNEIILDNGDEDIHSKIENILTSTIGETGKKIHTGRSRNDQVQVVMRMFEKENLIRISLDYIDLLKDFIVFAQGSGKIILPGYTHTKQAMLSTVGFWITAFIESGLDNLNIMDNVFSIIDSNPLGSGSGFGVPVPLDRDLTTSLLGFGKTQMNPAHVQNSRGKYESYLIDSFWNIMNDFSRMAADLLMYNMDELLFVKTGNSITTGSSIMPQKRNLDVMELVRARTLVMLSYSTLVKNLSSGIHSGYNRDLQETKEPVFKSVELIKATIKAVSVVIKHIDFDEAAIRKSLSKGIFATDIAFDNLSSGMPFRDSYKSAAKKIEEIVISDVLVRESIYKRNSPGSPITIDYANYSGHLEKFQTIWKSRLDVFHKKMDSLIESD